MAKNKLYSLKILKRSLKHFLRWWSVLNPKLQSSLIVSLVFLGCFLLFSVVHQNDYKLSQSEVRLLSRSSVDLSTIKQSKNTISYAAASMSEDNTNSLLPHSTAARSITLASQADSTGDTPYKVSFNKEGSQGFSFGDSKGDLSFKMQPLGNNVLPSRLIDGHLVFAGGTGKQVYTFKRNGIKNDILLSQSPGSGTATYSWKMELNSRLSARQLRNGSIGIYSASPYLYGDLKISDAKSQILIDKARQNAQKDNLVFILPAPYITDKNGKINYEDVSFSLNDDVLTLKAKNLQSKSYPLSIDPTVVATTTADFRTGTDDGMIDYSTTDEIKRNSLSLGTTGTWTVNTNYSSIPRIGHSTVAYNGYLYIIGGQESASNTSCKDSGTNNQCNDIQYAQINSNGSIGTFTTNTNYFSYPRSGHASVAYNGYLYIIGGQQASSGTTCKDAGTSLYCNDVQYAQINSNGSIGTFTTNTNYFAVQRRFLTAVTYNGYIYIAGGITDSTSSCKNAGTSTLCNDVQYALIKADGSVGAFTTNTNYFSFPRNAHTSVAYNGYLYIIGGQEGTSDTNCKSAGTNLYCNDIQYATINSDGSIGTFTTNANYFSFPRYLHASVAYNGYLYVVGGFEATSDTNCKNSGTSQYCNDTQYAPIYANGSLGTFTANTNYFSVARMTMSVIYNGYLYVVNGQWAGPGDTTTCKGGSPPSSVMCNDVQYAQINTGTPSFGTINTFSTSANYFSIPRVGHASVAYNGYLYVMGGQTISTASCKDTGTSGGCNDVQYAQINSDGSIGTWTTNTNYFSFPRSAFVSIAYNSYLYIIGGQQLSSDTNCKDSGTSIYCNDVQYAQINSNGSVGTFTTNANYFSFPRAYLSSVAYNGYLYIVGGQEIPSDTNCKDSGTSTKCNDVQYAQINANGSVGTFTTSTNYFAFPRQGPTAVAYNGYLYVAAGAEATSDTNCKNSGTSTFCNDIQYAVINSNGSIGTFTTNTNYFAFPRSGLAMFAYNGYLYIIGGGEATSDTNCKNAGTSTKCNDTQYAAINSNGSIGSFTTSTNYFSVARYFFGAAAYNGYFYITGGQWAGPSDTTTCKGGGPVSSSYCNDTQYVRYNGPAQTAAYERVIDASAAAATIDTIQFNGTTVCGAHLSYRVAGSNGVFGSRTDVYWVDAGQNITIGQTARYLWLKYTLDDSVCGITSRISDITLTYTPLNAAPAAPTLVYPTNGATDVAVIPQYQFRSTDVENDYLRYKVEICSDNLCNNILETGDQTSSQTAWSGQDASSNTAYVGNSVIGNSTIANYQQVYHFTINTTYYWRAYAKDPAGSNTWSSVSSIYSFTTTNPPPSSNVRGGTNVQGGSIVH